MILKVTTSDSKGFDMSHIYFRSNSTTSMEHEKLMAELSAPGPIPSPECSNSARFLQHLNRQQAMSLFALSIWVVLVIVATVVLTLSARKLKRRILAGDSTQLLIKRTIISSFLLLSQVACLAVLYYGLENLNHCQYIPDSGILRFATFLYGCLVIGLLASTLAFGLTVCICCKCRHILPIVRTIKTDPSDWTGIELD